MYGGNNIGQFPTGDDCLEEVLKDPLWVGVGYDTTGGECFTYDSSSICGLMELYVVVYHMTKYPLCGEYNLFFIVFISLKPPLGRRTLLYHKKSLI